MKVKRISDNKVVLYHGKSVTVPIDTVAIAADSNGEIWSYQVYQPRIVSGYCGFALSSMPEADCERIRTLKVEFDNDNEWQDSLVEYPLEDE